MNKETRGRKPVKEPRNWIKKTRLNDVEKERFDKMKEYYGSNDSELLRIAIRNMWSRYIIDIQRTF